MDDMRIPLGSTVTDGTRYGVLVSASKTHYGIRLATGEVEYVRQNNVVVAA